MGFFENTGEQQMVTEEFRKEILEEARRYVDNDFSKRVEDWCIDTFAPQIERWVDQEHDPRFKADIFGDIIQIYEERIKKLEEEVKELKNGKEN